MQLSSDKSLKDKLGVDLDRLKKDSNGAQTDHFNDGLSDDEEYQNMSEKERNERMRAKLNMDGAIEVSDSDSDFGFGDGFEFETLQDYQCWKEGLIDFGGSALDLLDDDFYY